MSKDKNSKNSKKVDQPQEHSYAVAADPELDWAKRIMNFDETKTVLNLYVVYISSIWTSVRFINV